MKKTGKSFFIIMIAVTAVILAIMAVSFKTETSAASAVGSVFAPVQKAAAFIVNGISGGVADIKNSSKNARSLKLLKKNLNRLPQHTFSAQDTLRLKQRSF